MAGYARQFAQGWVDHFRHKRGGRPTDSYWREFRAALGLRSGGLCWYCERRCHADAEVGGRAATVDHFRPLSRCPELAYEWTNWVFSCHNCNTKYKKEKWPAFGYINPGAADVCERPERYFDYDVKTNDIVPHPSLQGDDKRKAQRTIDDLKLNRLEVRFYRADQIRQFMEDWEDWRRLPAEVRAEFVDYALGKGIEYVGAIGMVVRQMLDGAEKVD